MTPKTVAAHSPALQPVALATVGSLVLAGAIYFGSSRLAYFDPALAGYCGATVVACFATAYRVVAFWQRRPVAFYGRALAAAVLHPARLLHVMRTAGRDLAAQRFIARRSRWRWLAHMLLAWGTLIGFAVTLPLVWGWMRFEAAGDHRYRPVFFSWSLPAFATDGTIGWLIFHALHLAAGAVLLGATYFLITRLRLRRQPGTASRFHLAPLLLLLAVALTGLVLPVAASTSQGTFRVAAAAHEAAVIALLVAIPFGKLIHLFIRPLHLGVQLVRATSSGARCARCQTTMLPTEQLQAVEALLAARGVCFAEHQRLCPACRRRQIAAVHTQLFGAAFQPRAIAPRGRLRQAA